MRGHSAYHQKSDAGAAGRALLVEALWISAVFAILGHVLRLSPLPNLRSVALTLGVSAALALILRFFMGGTPGELIWKVRWRFQAPYVLQNERLIGADLTTAWILTLLLFGGWGVVLKATLAKHPLFLRAESVTLISLNPPADSPNRWARFPMFYADGSWPRTYEGHPILYTLPYAKGPPQKFVGQIIARWSMPEVQVTFYGPNTRLTRRDLQSCLGQSAWYFPCLSTRRVALGPHVSEMEADLSPRIWKLKWFRTQSPTRPDLALTEGFYLYGQNENRVQERYVFINDRGAQQAIVLDRRNNVQGEAAHQLFEDAIRSQRMGADLAANRKLIDQALRGIHLDTLPTDRAHFDERIADVQSLLIAKITVDPAVYDSYFHLGGTSMLLAEHASQSMNADWSAVARKLLMSAYRYAQDVGPTDPRTRELESMLLSIKKY